ncbi:unnamed protein product [Clonostachys chloroleuca]|uniref:Uncharacterized protein n=1 Tax=Clonostachys chloroleuca TaxID=1926264 RepID=A0AA35MH26_9HYPO|nr:unnamed protein product [Clonostachys chloroleuca]
MPRSRLCTQRRFTARPTLLLALVSFFAIIGITTLTSRIPPSPGLSHDQNKKITSHVTDYLKKSSLNPFRQPLHAPPPQKDDEYKGSSWWADWKWLSVPFSSYLTLDEDRSILPPLARRPPVYCYYDATVKKTKDEKDAESELLLTWRRAWWAQGFWPVILSAAEAMNNPNYDLVQRLSLDPAMKDDLMRWLAWESMGDGLLAHSTVLPMASRQDPLIQYLRRGEYPKLSTWKNLDGGLVAGHKTELSAAIHALVGSSDLKDKKTVVSALSDKEILIEKATNSLASYSSGTIEERYAEILAKEGESKTKQLQSLNKLMNSHLHHTWRSAFPKGIEVLKPFPEHTAPLIGRAMRLAEYLLSCPETPIPSSCPPNAPKCTPCGEGQQAAKGARISTPAQYHNATDHFTIGTVPHPWTLATLSNLRERLDVPWIRRESKRDPWLDEVMRDLLSGPASRGVQIMRFKQAVAGDGALAYTFWFPAEDMPVELNWQFGFDIPKSALDDPKTASPDSSSSSTSSSTSSSSTESSTGTSSTADAAAAATTTATAEKRADEESKEKDSKKKENKDKDNKDKKSQEKDSKDKESVDSEPQNAPEDVEDVGVKEQRIFDNAKKLIALTKSTDETKMRASLEAWSMADTEIWKFTRAFQARRIKVRTDWEKEEAGYSRGAGTEGGRTSWSRWQDHKGDK